MMMSPKSGSAININSNNMNINGDGNTGSSRNNGNIGGSAGSTSYETDISIHTVILNIIHMISNTVGYVLHVIVEYMLYIK